MAEVTASEEFRKFLIDLLPKSQHGKIPAIIVEFETYTDGVSAVLIDGARVGVETIEAYGLEIILDAHGNAERVTSLRGDLIPEWYGVDNA